MSELFLKILNMSISASWLVLAVSLLRLVLKKAPKWVSVLLWGFVAIRLVCPFSFESVFSLIPSGETISPEIMMDHTPEVHTGIDSLNSVINPIISESFTPKLGASVNPLQIWIALAAMVWLAGIAVMLIYTAVSYFLLRRKVVMAVRLRNNIFQSENVAAPFVLGIITPKIYLPFQMDDQNLEHVIAHEEAHIRRKDHWWKPFGFVLLALHWFNPLVWLGYILLCKDIELACDEKVIKEMDNEAKADYTQALVACSVNRHSIAACPLAFGEVGVKERVKSVMNYKKPAFWIIVASVIACTLVAVCFLTNPISHTLQTIDGDNLGSATGENASVFVLEGDAYICVGSVEQTQLQELYDIRISRRELSQDRSEDRDRTHSLFLHIPRSEISLSSYLPGTYIHFNADFTQVWADCGVKPTLTYKVINPEKARAIFLSISARNDDQNLEPIEIVKGNLKTYYKNPDGTWQYEGLIYQYRLEITGRMPNAVVDSTFVYLSNLETISFARAWRAAGVSSNLSDYFSPGEAVLVEWTNGSANSGDRDENLTEKPEPDTTENITEVTSPMDTSAENEITESPTMQPPTTESVLQEETSVDIPLEGNTNTISGSQLIVAGRCLSAGKYMEFCDTAPRYVLVPFGAVMRELGAEVTWKTETVAQICLNGKNYTLNTQKVSLIEDGSDFNCIIPTPGGSLHSKAMEYELLLDYITVKTVALIMGMDIRVDIDYQNQIVVIDYTVPQKPSENEGAECLSIALSIVETLPGCNAFHYLHPYAPYCFYAFDADGNLYRVLWTDCEGLNEKDSIIVEYRDLKKLDQPNPTTGWNPQYEITALSVKPTH